MQCDTIDNCSHGEFRYTRVQECTLEIMCSEGSAHLEEGIGLVAVGQVGRRHDHVLHLLGESGQHIGRSGTCSDTGFVGNGGIVYIGHLAVNEVLKLSHGVGILLGPGVDVTFALCNEFTLGICALGIKFSHLGEYNPGVFGISAQVLDGFAVVGTRFAQRVAVCAALALKVLAIGRDGATSHDGTTDDDGGTFFFDKGFVQRVGECNRISAVTLNDVPIPRAVLHRGILIADSVTISR